MNYEKRGVLHPEIGSRADRLGVYRRTTVYRPDELTAIKRRVPRAIREPNALSAQAFDLFHAGTKLEEIVRVMRTTPEEVERLHEKWLDFGGARLVIAGTAKAELVKIVGSFDSVAELVELVIKLKPLTAQVEQSAQSKTSEA